MEKVAQLLKTAKEEKKALEPIEKMATEAILYGQLIGEGFVDTLEKRGFSMGGAAKSVDAAAQDLGRRVISFVRKKSGVKGIVPYGAKKKRAVGYGTAAAGAAGAAGAGAGVKKMMGGKKEKEAAAKETEKVATISAADLIYRYDKSE